MLTVNKGTEGVKLGIMCDMNLFIELINLKRFPRYNFAKTGRPSPFSAICMEKLLKKVTFRNAWPKNFSTST